MIEPMDVFLLEVAVVGLVNPPLLCNLFFDGVMVP
jgi:hypothetical protein